MPRLRLHALPKLFLLGASLLAADNAHAVSTVKLKSGTSLQGDILAERADRVVVDLGFTVLTVPRDEIDRITAENAAGSSPLETTGDLFRVNPSQTTFTVKENVDRVGEAVVLVRTPSGLGSGFFIHPDGYVITNNHVVSGEYTVSITQFRRGKAELEKVVFNKVRIVALDSTLDLALLKIEDAPAGTVFPSVPLGENATDGQTVFAIGSPLGLDRTVSQGIISSGKRNVGGGQLYIQTTTQINPGNSGGPLFNLRGEVVGVNNMKIVIQGVEGLNFAIPVVVLKEFLRNRDSYAFDPRHPNAGYRYLEPPRPLVKAPADAAPIKPVKN